MMIAMPRLEPLTDVQLRELAAEYVRGQSIRQLASVNGWSFGFTHKRLQVAAQQGLMKMRPRGARRVLTQEQ